jgi:hypothetical protein
MTAQAKPMSAIYRVLAITTAVALSPIWIPLLVLWLVFYILASICLYLAIWLLWLPRSKHILFVFSEGPIWHDYIEQHILPVIREQAVVLNWSQRRSWRCSLAVAAFKHFGGWRDFNPMAVVFRPFHRARVFRFLPPFRDYKHGKPENLLAMQQEFFDYSRAYAIRANV